jgi:hypothetical protein
MPALDRVVRSAAAAVLLSIVVTPVVVAQETPACDPTLPASECQLAAWPVESQLEAPSPFGPISGTAWVTDGVGDVGPAGLDIQAVGVGSVDIAEPGPLRRSPDVLLRGRRIRAIRAGEGTVVRIVLDGAIDRVTDGYAGVHVATDIDRSRTNNAPAGVGSRRQPFAGSEDVYSVAYASTTGRTELLDSDLSRGWYRDRDAFAAAWAAPNVLDVLVRPEGMGDGFRAVTFTSADDGGYDVVDLGVGDIPANGLVGFRPSCLAAAITTEPFVVRRLAQAGQVVRNVEAPASWLGGAAFRLDGETRAMLADFAALADDDADGRVELPASVDLFEDGTVMSQRPTLSLALEGDVAQLAVQLGLTRRGFDVVRQITLEPTSDAAVDAWLARATDAFVGSLPPFRVARRGGSLVGDVATCLSALADPDAPGPAAGSPEPDASAGPSGAAGATAAASPDPT